MDAIAPVLKQIPRYVDFTVDYISTDLGNGNFQSLHGQTETDGNIVELCAAKYYSESYRYMDLITCMDKNARAIPGNWEACAQESKMDTTKLKTCITGDEGKQLLSASVKRTQEASARGSPTIYLNGQRYQGGRQTSDFMRSICNVLKTKPPECENIPEPAAVPAQPAGGGC